MPITDEQQVPGIAPPPVMSSDQILQHVDSVYQGLPDPVRRALDHAHTLTGGGASGLSAVAKPTPYNPQTGENYGGNPALHDLLNRPNHGMPEIQTLPAEKPGNGGVMQLLSDSGGAGLPPVESGRASGPMIPGMSGVTSDMLKPSADTGDGMPFMPSRISIPDTGVASPPMAHLDSTIAPLPSAVRQEESRLTAPPLPSSDPNAHTKLDTGRTGIGQIHNPWLRGLATAGDVIASGVFPNFGAFIPGTTAHHQLLVNEAGGAVKQENENRKSDADVAHSGAETSELGSKANEENARAESLLHPPAKEELEGKTVTTADGVMAWNPATHKYDTRVGDAPPDKGAITHFLDKDGNVWKLNHDGTATPIKGPEGTQLQGTPTGPEGERKLGNVEQLNKALETRYQVLHPGGPLPPQFTLPANATQKDYERIDKVMEGTERALGTKSQQDAANEARKQTSQLAQARFEDQKANREDKSDLGIKQATHKAFTPVLDSAERFNVMTKNYEDAVKNHDQQAMLSLLANHLGMTMGLQKGARLTKDIIHEAETSRPWLQGLEAKFDKNGYLTGVNLTQPQMRQMIGLGRERFSEDVRKARNESKYLGATDDGPDRTPNKSTINHYLSEANGDLNKAKQLAAEDGWSVK